MGKMACGSKILWAAANGPLAHSPHPPRAPFHARPRPLYTQGLPCTKLFARLISRANNSGTRGGMVGRELARAPEQDGRVCPPSACITASALWLPKAVALSLMLSVLLLLLVVLSVCVCVRA